MKTQRMKKVNNKCSIGCKCGGLGTREVTSGSAQMVQPYQYGVIDLFVKILRC